MNPLEQTYLQFMCFLMLDYCLFTIIYVYLCLLTIVGKRYLLSCLRGPRSDGHVFSVWKKRYVTWGAKCRKRLLGIGSIF